MATEAFGFVEALAALEFEGDTFGAAELADDLGDDGCAFDGRCADFDGVTLADQKHLAEGDFGIDCGVELFDVELVALLDAVLFTAGFDHCVGHGRGE